MHGATTVIRLPSAPWSPWLRLAHITTLGAQASGQGMLRTIDDCMLMLQLEGTSWIWWEDAGGSVALPTGAVAFVPPRRVHAWGECTGAHIAVHFDLHAAPALVPFAMLHPLERSVGPRPLPAMPVVELRPAAGAPLRIPLVTALRRPAWWQERLAPLIAMYRDRRLHGPAERLRAAEVLAWAVGELALPAEQGGAAGLPDPRIQQVVAELDRSYAQPWRVAGLARRAGMSEVAFRRAFARATGSSPRDHLEALRIDRAAHLLRATDQPVAAVAGEVGFADAYHFSRVFRRRMGVSPRGFRQQRPDRR